MLAPENGRLSGVSETRSAKSRPRMLADPSESSLAAKQLLLEVLSFAANRRQSIVRDGDSTSKWIVTINLLDESIPRIGQRRPPSPQPVCPCQARNRAPSSQICRIQPEFRLCAELRFAVPLRKGVQFRLAHLRLRTLELIATDLKVRSVRRHHNRWTRKSAPKECGSVCTNGGSHSRVPSCPTESNCRFRRQVSLHS